MNIIRERNASAFLLLNAVLWGSSYIWSKMLLSWLPFFTILFVFSFAGLIVLFIAFFKRIIKTGGRTILKGVGISGFSILSNIFCMLALQGTSSSNTAFIVQLSVIITPLLMSLIRRKLPGGRTVFSALAALAGLFLLTCDFGQLGFRLGDLFALCNALFFSLYLVALRQFSRNTDPVQFTFVQHAVSSLVFLILAACFETGSFGIAGLLGTGLLGTGIAGTGIAGLGTAGIGILALSSAISVLTILIQSSAINYVRPEKATVIYTLEPVTAAILAFILTGERMNGPFSLAGCALILFAVLCHVNLRNIASTQPKRNGVKYIYLQSVEKGWKKGA